MPGDLTATPVCAVMFDILVGAILFAAGIGVVWTAKRLRLDLGEASKTAIILLPLLVYLIVANKLTEFEGYGLKAKFREVSSERIIDTARAADLAISSAEANEPDFTKDAFWQLCRPYYVISQRTAIKADEPPSKPNPALDQRATINIAKSIRASLICGKFQGLVVVDSAKKPVGLFARDQFLELLRLPIEVYGTGEKCSPTDQAFCEKLFKDISATELGPILSHPEERAKSDEAHKVVVAWSASLAESYKKFVDEAVNVAMIIDRHGRFDGIITRSAIESRVVGKLIEATK